MRTLAAYAIGYGVVIALAYAVSIAPGVSSSVDAVPIFGWISAVYIVCVGIIIYRKSKRRKDDAINIDEPSGRGDKRRP